MDIWRSKCGGLEPICPRLAPSLSALAKPSPSLQKVSSRVARSAVASAWFQRINHPLAAQYSTSSCPLSLLQLASTTWASVVTWTSPRASACRHSGSPFWMTWDSRSWRGLRALSLSCACQWTASWGNRGRLKFSLTTLCLTVSDVIWFYQLFFFCLFYQLRSLVS